MQATPMIQSMIVSSGIRRQPNSPQISFQRDATKSPLKSWLKIVGASPGG